MNRNVSPCVNLQPEFWVGVLYIENFNRQLPYIAMKFFFSALIQFI